MHVLSDSNVYVCILRVKYFYLTSYLASQITMEDKGADREYETRCRMRMRG